MAFGVLLFRTVPMFRVHLHVLLYISLALVPFARRKKHFCSSQTLNIWTNILLENKTNCHCWHYLRINVHFIFHSVSGATPYFEAEKMSKVLWEWNAERKRANIFWRRPAQKWQLLDCPWLENIYRIAIIYHKMTVNRAVYCSLITLNSFADHYVGNFLKREIATRQKWKEQPLLLCSVQVHANEMGRAISGTYHNINLLNKK